MTHTLRSRPRVPPEKFRRMCDDWGISRRDLLDLLPVTIERFENWRSGVDGVPFQYWWILELLADPCIKRWALDHAHMVSAMGVEDYTPTPFTWVAEDRTLPR